MKTGTSPYLLTALFVLLPVLSGVVGIYFLYATALGETRERLRDSLANYGRLMDAITRQERSSAPEGADAAERSRGRIREALGSYPGIGRTGELVLARKRDERIMITFRQRAANPDEPVVLPRGDGPPPALERALQGESGVVRGVDHRGREVIAAYQPLPGMAGAGALQAEVEAIQAPYWRAGWITVLFGALLGVVGAVTYLRVVAPLWRELDAQKHHLGNLLANLPGMVFQCRNDPGWNMEYVSDGASEVTGYAPDALRMYPFGRLIHPEDRERVREAVGGAVADGGAYEVTYRLRDAEGGQRWVWERGQPVAYAGEAEARLEGFITDITEARETAETCDRQAAILEAAPDLVGLADASGNLLYLNTAGRRLLGGSDRAEVAGRTLADLYPERWRERLRGEVLPVARERGQWRGEVSLLRPDGGEAPMAQVVLAHRDASGEVGWYSTTTHDLSQWKAAEENARQRLAEISRVARASTAGEMGTQLAHELNQPLAAISTYSQACWNYLDRPEPDYERVYRILEELQNQALRAGEIIQRLRSRVRKDRPRWQAMDLNAALEEILGLLWGETGLQGVRLSSGLAPFLPPIHGDPTLVEQVVLNLIRNAAEAMEGEEPRSGEARIRVETRQREGDHALVSVHDSGPGLSSSGLQEAFQAYATSKPEGLGLGLRTSLSIVEAHGGRMWVEPNEWGGATFRFTLPFARSERSESPERVGLG
ncbi:MAG: PAS domain-containing protein [Thiohalorhabdus sp.]